jgi:uncharacterized membrane protein YcaP (DUF421 family)
MAYVGRAIVPPYASGVPGGAFLAACGAAAKEAGIMETLWAHLQSVLDLSPDPQDPDAISMALRTVVIYAFTLVIVRLGSRRLLSKPSAFDVIVAIMVGSIMSRAINGSAPFMPTLGAGAVLLFLHWAFAAAAFRVHWISAAVKGTRIPLIRDGKVLQEGVRRAQLSEDDLVAVLRLQIQDEDVSKVAVAYMERSGEISVIPRRRE